MNSPKPNQGEQRAQGMLNKWHKMKKTLYEKPQHDRPSTASSCNSLQQCDRWRQDIIKEICDKVSDIQNAGLGEFRIRALNDEINKLLNEKRHWDARIKELGGPDYSKLEQKLYDRDGIELPGSGGYKYFGAAKDLPGVRDLFYREAPAPPSKSIGDLSKRINYSYYGFGIDMQNDPITGENLEDLEALERELESRDRAESTATWLRDNYDEISQKIPEIDDMTYEETIDKLSKGELRLYTEAEDEQQREDNQKHLHMMQQQKQQELLERLKRDLINTFVEEFDNDAEALRGS